MVGTSVGGVRTGQALRTAGFDGEIVLVGAEDVAPYDKPPLSKQVLVGAQSGADIALLGAGGWAAEGLTPVLGRPATALDPDRRQVVLSDGERIDYDVLVVATGAAPRTIPSAPGALVRTVRELRDSESIRAQFAGGGPVVVVGSGFIGAEVASSARALGLETTVVEALPEPFAGVLGSEVGALIRQLHIDAGVSVHGSALVDRVEALSDGSGVVHLTDGRRLPAATVVVGIGVTPQTDWLRGSGLDLQRGVLTDEFCRAVGVPDVYALGDVARWFDVRTGVHRLVEHWTNAVEQATAVAHHVVHPDDLHPHVKAPYFWSDQHGLKIQMVGRISPEDQVSILRFSTPVGEKDVALYSHDGSFSAAVVLGWPRAVVACRQEWERGAGLAQITDRLATLASAVRPLVVP
ncbi:MAG: phthalate 3,4-dioxygenase, ferredoxin reductase subunit [Blastococcus sp.]|nr:phthalate 3,4-dioxygenase, ferredoxin reductase subunit [Blastococcus sp.]